MKSLGLSVIGPNYVIELRKCEVSAAVSYRAELRHRTGEM